jgi:biotin carboxyl carrier protein
MAETAERIVSKVDFSDPATIASLSAALQAAGVDGIEIEQPSRKVRIVVEPGAPGAVPPVRASQYGCPATRTDAATATTAKAPMAGFFGRGHPASVAKPSELPRDVAAGETLGFVRVGPVLLPVKASEAGVLTRCVAEDGSRVGYGDPLFEIEPCP